ncbi:GntR family transcriptional regulator [Ochrobactrum teleogrylli]
MVVDSQAAPTMRVTHRQTLRQMTEDRLREAIQSGVLLPGQRLSERDLSSQMGVSRSSIREAIQGLESEGLLFRSRAKGVFVGECTIEQARQIYEIRAALEPIVAKAFARQATPLQIKELREILGDIGQCIANKDSYGYVQTHAKFFEIIFSNSGNEIATEFLRTLASRIARLRMLTFGLSDAARQSGSIALLTQIIDAASDHDEARIASVMEKLITRSANFCEEVMMPDSLNHPLP